MANHEGVAFETYQISDFPGVERIWDTTPEQFITDPVSLQTGINFKNLLYGGENVHILGANTGDEGKGTWVYRLANNRSLSGIDGVTVVRTTGGIGAGHEFVPIGAREPLVHHLLSAGISHTMNNIVGRGVLSHPETLVKEIDQLHQRGYKPNIGIDASNFLHWDAHKMRDIMEEEARGGNSIGTTKSGIGPAASDYYGRHGMRIGDLLKSNADLRTLVEAEVERNNRILAGFHEYDPVEVFEQFLRWKEYLAPYLMNTLPIVYEAVDDGRLIGEAAQAFRLGRETGFDGSTTSTNSGTATFEQQYMVSRRRATNLGVIKPVPTFVGRHTIHSPLPEDQQAMLYDRTSQRGSPETGRTSGRRRNYGRLSVPELLAAVEAYDLHGLLISKADVIEGLPYIEIGLNYVFADGTVTDIYDPKDPRMSDPQTRMNVLRMPMWSGSIAGLNRFEDAPRELRAFVDTVQHLAGVPVVGVGTGGRFEDAMYRKAA
ncbi:adenylosuccinate synthetase [Candidatus Roizmanbacteria bacterium]|nr:adenylosuccinate synthetase [Candidatus Roizmanbacteria bacterium]